MELDCAVEPPWPAATDWEELTASVAQAVANLASELANPRLCASILFADDDAVAALNREWRGKDGPTNVLSFPMISREELLALPSEGPPVFLGDIALSCETCTREASEKAARIEDHARHLIAHGLLHLAGYDHETGPEDAEAMERLEIKTLALLGIANPYED